MYLCGADFFSWMTQKHLKFVWKYKLGIPTKTCFPLQPFIHLNGTQSTRFYKPKTWESTFTPYPEYMYI